MVDVNRQCTQVFVTRRGDMMIFCCKNHGHKGDHRGDRKQWRVVDGKQVQVPITEKCP